MAAHSLLMKKKRIIAMMFMQLSFLAIKIWNINLLNVVTKLYENFVVYPPVLNTLLRRNLPKLKMRMRVTRNHLRKRRVTWYHPGQTDNWWQNMYSNVLPAEEWKKNFRLSFRNQTCYHLWFGVQRKFV